MGMDNDPEKTIAVMLARIDAEAALEKFVLIQPGLLSAVLNTSKGTFVWVPTPQRVVAGTRSDPRASSRDPRPDAER
jgi:hypothetical protein